MSRRRRVAAVGLVAVIVGFAAAGVVSRWGRGPTDDDVADTGRRTHLVSYDLALTGASLVKEETLTARGIDVALWFDERRRTYLSLAVREGLAEAAPAPAGVGPMVEDSSLPEAEGRAWMSDLSDTHTRSLRMWWARADGDLWLAAQCALVRRRTDHGGQRSDSTPRVGEGDHAAPSGRTDLRGCRSGDDIGRGRRGG